MRTKSIVTVAIILVTVVLCNAQVPQLINYQGKLKDATGNPVDGTVEMQFSMYDAETGGTGLWAETQTVQVTDGLFNVLLGSVTPIPYSVFSGAEIYLELKVGSDPAMTPRQQLVSVGYAMHSNDADKLGGNNATDYVKSVDGISPHAGNIDLVEGSNVTIESDPQNKTITISAAGGSGGGSLTLPYTGTTESSATAFSVTNTGSGRAGYFKINKFDNNNQAIYGETSGLGRAGHFRITNSNNNVEALAASTQGSGSALSGYTIGSGAAVYGRTDGSGEAGHFEITNPSDSSSVIYGETNGKGRVGHFRIANAQNDKEAVAASTQGTGPALSGYTTGRGSAVYGRNDGTGEAGHFWINNANNNSPVIYGETNGMGRAGHFRIVNTDNDKEAVAASTQGTGPALSGYTTGSGSAVYGRTDGTGTAVYGEHTNSGNYGYLGDASKGVSGYSEKGTGVYGTSSSGNAVWGDCKGNGHGVHGYSRSGVGVNGYSGEGIGVRGESISGTAVNAEGDLYVTGAYRGNISSSSGSDGAPFPRPAYDSGWFSIDKDLNVRTLTHNIGKDVDNYVVDMQFKHITADNPGISNKGIGGDTTGALYYGFYWRDLTAYSITVQRGASEAWGGLIRVRIWYYN
jgi:hypothetical protein